MRYSVSTEAPHQWRRPVLAISHLQEIKLAESGIFQMKHIKADFDSLIVACRYPPHTHAIAWICTGEVWAAYVAISLDSVETAT